MDKYDEDGFVTDKQFLIPKGSVWELGGEKLEIALSPCVRLDRVWKSKKAKSKPWIEITPWHLERFLKKWRRDNEEMVYKTRILVDDERFLLRRIY